MQLRPRGGRGSQGPARVGGNKDGPGTAGGALPQLQHAPKGRALEVVDRGNGNADHLQLHGSLSAQHDRVRVEPAGNGHCFFQRSVGHGLEQKLSCCCGVGCGLKASVQGRIALVVKDGEGGQVDGLVREQHQRVHGNTTEHGLTKIRCQLRRVPPGHGFYLHQCVLGSVTQRLQVGQRHGGHAPS